METFFTILAYVFTVLSVARIAGIFYGAKENAGLIRAVEAIGGNPVGEALVRPVITLLVCIAWIVSTFI